MSLIEIPPEYATLSPLINYLNGGDQQFEANFIYPTILEDINDVKIGYEETVVSSTELTPLRSAQYDDISDDESNDSMSSLFSNLPKSVSDWNTDHIMKWILELYHSSGYRFEDLNLDLFRKQNGNFLVSVTEKDCVQIDKKRSKWLYENVQKLIHHSNQCSEISSTTISYLTGSDEDVDPVIPPRRKRGRPRSATAKRRPEHKIGRVWEFLRDLLLDPKYCPNLIYWEDYDTKKFRLVDGSKVAKLWGQKKNNPSMTYEKFSRTIRHYYKDKVILSVPKEKLVYRFGENAKGIETSQPNFGIPVNLR